MPLKIPPDLKKITQYIRRAEELDRDTTPQTRIVAYYCRQHAVQVGIPLVATPQSRECLGAILNDLEKEKKAMSNFTKDEGYAVCREFAMKIFDRADAVDRAGKSNKSTAKSFYAAASFLDVLTHFHSGSDTTAEEEKSNDLLEEEKKSFYAKWKATDILKALREGREIKPGGFGEDPEEENDNDDAYDDEVKEIMGGGNDDVTMPSTNYDDHEPKEEGTEVPLNENSLLPPPPYPATASSAPSAPTYDEPKPVPTPQKSKSSSGGGFMGGMFRGKKGNGKYSKAVLSDAKELTNFALKALSDKNGDLAVERLQQALEVLTQV
jgi:vacuolar protein sorting-associated protein VTA1